MNVNEFFNFKLEQLVFLKSGFPTRSLLKIIEIRKMEGARTGNFTLVDSKGEKYSVTGLQLINAEEVSCFEKRESVIDFPIPEGTVITRVKE